MRVNGVVLFVIGFVQLTRDVSSISSSLENLSYLRSKSAAYVWETKQKISFADENFAVSQALRQYLALLQISPLYVTTRPRNILSEKSCSCFRLD